MLKKFRGRSDDGVHVAAFGKHPAWEDHIPDLGVTTERLVQVKRELYLDGIGRNIDTGHWAEIDEAHRLEGVDHVFGWFQRAEWVVGRMWASVDAKGRSKYPMVTCVQAPHLRFDDVAATVARHLADLEAACRAATTPEQVAAAVGAAAERLTRETEGALLDARRRLREGTR